MEDQGYLIIANMGWGRSPGPLEKFWHHQVPALRFKQDSNKIQSFKHSSFLSLVLSFCTQIPFVFPFVTRKSGWGASSMPHLCPMYAPCTPVGGRSESAFPTMYGVAPGDSGFVGKVDLFCSGIHTNKPPTRRQRHQTLKSRDRRRDPAANTM